MFMIFLVQCTASLFYYVFFLSSSPTCFHTAVARYSLMYCKCRETPINLEQHSKELDTKDFALNHNRFLGYIHSVAQILDGWRVLTLKIGRRGQSMC